MKAKPTSTHPAQLTLNLTTSAGVVAVKQPGGAVLLKPGEVKLKGTVRDAMKTLGAANPDVIYQLIRDKEIKAIKLRDTAPNCKWQIDMLSVYDLKERREAEQEKRA